jgi:hypothetical protein
MRHHTLLLATAVLTAGLLADTADAAQRQRWGNGNGGGRQGGGRREAPPQARSTPPPQEQRVQPQEQRVQPRAEASGEPRSRRAVPRYEGGSNDGRSTEGRVTDGRTADRTGDGGRVTERTYDGRATDRRRYDTRTYDNTRRDGNRVAVPRPYGQPPVRRDDRYRVRTYSSGGRTFYYSPRYYSYRPYYYYRPNYYSPFVFGYGPRGRGYFYFDVFYDSYVFYPRTIVRYNDYGRYGYPTGELRLDVEPRDAQVYIDGAYAGLVDDFDGIFQSLRLEVGEYQVEVVSPGFEPLVFDVRIPPGEKVTYRGDLLPERP